MSRRYAGQITLPVLARSLAVVAIVTAAVLGFVHWLAPRPIPPAAAASSATDVVPPAPGGIQCPAGPPPTAPPASLLIDCPDVFDGQVIDFQGEVIEVIVRRGGYAVAVLNDDGYGRDGPVQQTRTALGGNSGLTALMPGHMEQDITILGSYRERGDIVAVRGRFTAANDVLGGEPAIVATTARVVLAGAALQHRIDVRTAWAAGLLTLVASTVSWLAWRRRRP